MEVAEIGGILRADDIPFLTLTAQCFDQRVVIGAHTGFSGNRNTAV